MCSTNNFCCNLKVILIALLSGAVLFESYIVESRAVPRSNSRSFRFPSSGEEKHETFPANTIPRESTSARFAERDEGRNSVIITLDSNPAKTAVPESPAIPTTTGDESNAGSLEEQEILSSEAIDGESSNNVDENIQNHEDKDLREALCPTANASFPVVDPSKLRYDLRAGKCAEVGTTGHCGKNMIFVAEIDSSAYGFCECDFENKILRKEIKQAALLTRTPLVYHVETNACYRLYEKGYCGEDEWLVLSRVAKSAVCEQKRCPNKPLPEPEKIVLTRPSRQRTSKLLTPSFWTQSSIGNSTELVDSKLLQNGSETKSKTVKGDPIWVPLNGIGPCVQLFERSPEHCTEPDEKVLFAVGDIVPKCGYTGRGIEGRAIIRNACPPGSFYSIIGRCQPDWDF